MKYYSWAGASRGTTDPVETFVYEVDEHGNCNLRGCTDEDCSHIVMMWSGNEFSKNSTWISADKKYTISLEDAR